MTDGTYQRFSFSNLPLERQMEILEKQRRQQLQREYLEEQIRSKQEQKQPKTAVIDETRPSLPAPRTQQTTAAAQRFAIPAARIYKSTRQPLLEKRSHLPRDNWKRHSLTLTPDSMHKAFSELRQQIRSSCYTPDRFTPTFTETDDSLE